jgi:hypothetical protein
LNLCSPNRSAILGGGCATAGTLTATAPESRISSDEAVPPGLADTNWTAYDQTGSYQNLPPAVIIDLDETAIDNSPYEAGLVHRRRLSGLFSFNPDRPDGPLCLNLDLPFSRWLATGRTSPDSRGYWLEMVAVVPSNLVKLTVNGSL